MEQSYIHNQQKSGFTLVELSIVLVIIGLLIGGILVAQSLIDSANSQRVISLANQQKAMMLQFEARFKCLPGDCTSAVVPATMDGNGSGMINSYAAGVPDVNEPILVLRQMDVLGIYQSPNDLSACVDRTTHNINCFLQGPHEDSIFLIRNALGGRFHYGPYQMATALRDDMYLTYGRYNPAAGSSYQSPFEILTPVEAAAIDSKVDDGSPATGTIISNARDNPDIAATVCLTAENASANVAYNVANDIQACNVYFFLGNAGTLNEDPY